MTTMSITDVFVSHNILLYELIRVKLKKKKYYSITNFIIGSIKIEKYC